MMTVVLERLDPAVPLRCTVRHTNNHQTLTALALIYHQVNVCEQTIKNPPPGLHQCEIHMHDYKGKVAWGEKVGREPPMLRWEVHLLTLILWYDQNT
jgi:hypothetical protein